MIKIAFFDIDGTLLPLGENNLSERTIYTLNELQKNKIITCMATGRGVLMMPRFEGVIFDVFMTFNGSYCFTDKEVIYKCPIPEKDVMRILENTRQMNRAIAISNERYEVSNGTDPDLEEYFSFAKGKVAIADDFEERFHDEIFKMMVSCNKSEHERIMAGADGAKITYWWDKAVDIIPAATGKGIAVEKILGFYGFSKDEAIAFGDGENDIEMLEAVGTGIAMGNAMDSVKSIADHVCRSAAEDGVYHCCKENKLIV
ncbi:MAG: HAD family hydrolase [Lachnospiraceae bacterium]|nr:HAD family hydrolase [Lachnospiraceae bacterium]